MPRRHHSNKVRLVMGFKNFSAHKGVCHIGLGVSGTNTCGVLRRNGIMAEPIPLVTPDDLYDYLENDRRITKPDHVRVTHVVISAPWIPTKDYKHLCQIFPDVVFTVLVHSNVGFLQADPRGVKLIREAADLRLPNFRLAGNCKEFVSWIRHAYGRDCWLTPNLYDFGPNPQIPKKHVWKDGPLRIGSFGAVRPLKNTMSAAGAALQISSMLDTPVEFWMSSNRTEGGGAGVVNAIHEMLHGTQVKIVNSPWEPWPGFRNTVAKVHLHLQPSYTESFNITVADAVSVGVPSVVSTAINWTPESWQADADDVGEIARVGLQLLRDPYAIEDGYSALHDYITHGVINWKSFMEGER